MILTQKLGDEILRRTRQMVGLVVVILGIITITAGAATGREFFHKEIQTVEFVRD